MKLATFAAFAWLSSAAAGALGSDAPVPSKTSTEGKSPSTPDVQVVRKLSTAVTYGQARKVRIQKTQQGNLQLDEVHVIVSNGTNIALNKNATQTSTLSTSGSGEDGSEFPASNAVDENKNTHSSTLDTDPTDYWEVDLGVVVRDIQFVKIYSKNADGDVNADAGLANAQIQLIDDDDEETVLSSKSVGDMTGTKEKAFEVGYHNSQPLWAIALGESSVSTDFTASQGTSENLNLKFQIGRGRVRATYSVHASCDTEEDIDILEGESGYSVNKIEHTPPAEAAAQGQAVDSVSEKYPHVESTTSTADFPYASSRIGCLRFCAILDGQANQLGMEAVMNVERTEIQKCRCLYHKGSLPETIPSYATSVSVDTDVESKELVGSGGINGTTNMADANIDANTDCYPFGGTSLGGINTGMDTLELMYNFNKSALTGSNIYNATSNQLKICQIVRLEIDALDRRLDDTPLVPAPAPLVITEEKNEIIIDFEMQKDFAISSTLQAATIEANDQSTTLSDYISAFKCTENGDQSTTALAPSTELYVCIKSDSLDVQIESIDSMKITGYNPTTSQIGDLVVMTGGGPRFSAITSFDIDNTSGPNPLAIVTTRVPSDRFDFEGVSNPNIEISGQVTLNFAGGVRTLMLGGNNRLLQAGNDEDQAAFDLTVGLESTEGTDQLGGAMMNSAKDIAGTVLTIIGMAFFTAYALW